MTIKKLGPKQESRVMVFKRESITPANEVMNDPFRDLYPVGLEGGPQTVAAVAPPYVPGVLMYYYENSSFLSPCVEAMVTNVDGTGFELRTIKGEKEDKKALKKAKALFTYPWPGESFIGMRKNLRRDLEVTGNAYMEVFRNMAGEVVMLRRLDPTYMRLTMKQIAFDVELEFPQIEGGKINVTTYPKVYVHSFGTKRRYMKEFAAPAKLSKITGMWEIEEALLPENVATEVMHLTLIPHPSGYGIPRWVPQTPSVVGSRKAEQQNVDFFESGGIPPLLIFVTGGTMSENVTKSLKELLYSDGKHKNIAAVVEVASNEGDLDKAGGGARVQVERFGGERQSDSMFEDYLMKSEKRIRSAFRIPPIFVGQAEDYNYATARASYEVGEAQVFAPERDDFDEIMNLRLLPAVLGDAAKTIEFVSNPISISDSDLQTATVTAAGDLATRESRLEALNMAANLDLEFEENPPSALLGPDGLPIDPEEADKGFDPKAGEGKDEEEPDVLGEGENPKKTPVKKTIAEMDLPAVLAKELNRVISGKTMDPAKLSILMKHVGNLQPKERRRLRDCIADEMHMAPEDLDFDLIEATISSLAA